MTGAGIERAEDNRSMDIQIHRKEDNRSRDMLYLL
jgi:hypothetical protein